MKSKIAISIDQNLLNEIDLYSKSQSLGSRSQTIEKLIQKGLEESTIKDAMIMSKPSDLKYLLTKIENKSVLQNNLELLKKAKVEKICLVTQDHPLLKKIKKLFPELKIIKLNKMQGTADNLRAFKSKSNDFIVLNSDTYYHFDLKKMIKKHKQSKKLATLGVISTTDAEKYGAVRLEDDQVVDFKQKEISAPVINAGFYIFNPEIFTLLFKDTISIEYDIMPVLVEKKQVNGFFVYGKYIHVQKMDNISE